jgi:hypothetical protein
LAIREDGTSSLPPSSGGASAGVEVSRSVWSASVHVLRGSGCSPCAPAPFALAAGTFTVAHAEAHV